MRKEVTLMKTTYHFLIFRVGEDDRDELRFQEKSRIEQFQVRKIFDLKSSH